MVIFRTTDYGTENGLYNFGYDKIFSFCFFWGGFHVFSYTASMEWVQKKVDCSSWRAYCRNVCVLITFTSPTTLHINISKNISICTERFLKSTCLWRSNPGHLIFTAVVETRAWIICPTLWLSCAAGEAATLGLCGCEAGRRTTSKFHPDQRSIWSSRLGRDLVSKQDGTGSSSFSEPSFENIYLDFHGFTHFWRLFFCVKEILWRFLTYL